MSDVEVTTLHGDGQPVDRIYARMQIVGAALYRDDAQRSALIKHMLRQPSPGYEITGDSYAVAWSFGKLVHTHPEGQPCEVTEDADACTIWPSTEDEATVALLRIEQHARKLDDEEESDHAGDQR